MVNQLLEWLDNRTGYKQMMHEALYENVPSGARWRYVTGSMLVFAFTVQAITGVFLWMGYSPSSQTAWESVYYIQHEMQGGWMVRGVHHFMAQAMVVVLALHLLQVVIDGAYRAPREVNYWLGLILMKIVLGLGLTGYLLPWDQKGYWATNVATNLMTLVPFAGAELQKVVVGGNEYGHATLTRFFALHAGVLPGLLVAFLGLHIMVFRRHGITAHVTPGRKDQDFWPHQVLLDAIACLVMLVVVVLCVVQFDVGGLLTGNLGDTGRLGAELGAPADPSEAYSAARPEWYYLFLFQLLKFFEGSTEWIGAIVLPGALVGLLFLMPIIGRSQAGHRFNVVAILLLVGGAGVLTVWAMVDDNFDKFAARFGLDPEKYEKQISSAKEFHEAKEKAEADAHRMIELVNRRQTIDGKPSQPLLIPKQGAVYLLRNDPHTQGPRLFAKHCASCHEYVDPADKSPVRLPMLQDPKIKDAAAAQPEVVRNDEGHVEYDEPGATAPNLFGFASRAWIRGLLDKDQISAVAFETVPSTDERLKEHKDHPSNHRRRIMSPYFGNTAHKDGRMAAWVKDHVGGIDKEDLESIVIALSAQARLRSQAEEDAANADRIKAGVKLIEKNCARGCHRFGDAGPTGLAPDLTGYGSYEWTLSFLSDPTHERFYRQENDRMPSFAKDLDQPARHTVSIRELSLIVDWMRGEYYQADDPLPVLPHAEETARKTVAAGRATGASLPAIVGAEPPPPPTKTARAERIFRDNCAACHSHVDGGGRGVVARQSSAPNLFGFASRDWVAGLLDPNKIATDHYFGATSKAGGDMVNFVNDNLKDLNDEKKAQLADVVAALSAEAALASQAESEQQAATKEQIGRGPDSFGKLSCTDCHKFRDAQDGSGGPDLTGYGSLAWLKEFIKDPNQEKFYDGQNDRMPAFGVSGAGTKKSLLSEEEIELVARWIRGEKLD